MKSAIALGLLVGSAFAQPHGHNHLHKRAKVTVYETEVVEVTATIVVAQDGSRETVPPAVQPSSDAKFLELSTTSPSSTIPSTTSTSTSTSTSTTTSSSSIIIPTTSSSVVVIPTTTSTYVPPIPTTSSVVIEVPTTTQAPVVPTTTSQVVAQPTTSASSGGGNGGGLSGEITYFTIGLGSCGDNYAGQDRSVGVVALAAAYYAANSNPCGKTITITASNGKTATGVVADKCPECAIGSIDVSEKIFLELFGTLDVGRSTMTWTIS